MNDLFGKSSGGLSRGFMSNDRKEIIIVDDVNFFLHTASSRLKKHYTVYTAQSSEKLFELLSKITPDLILLDINMPVVNGFEVLIKLKNDVRYSYIPVIIITANDDKDSLVKALSLGAADYVTKPFDATKLIRIINDLTDY